ncbi:diguanylate cyclase (GGDEF domain) with PAS/PAC sensor [hydrothermal vent metagenome]|uniref:Diguanylate cyclase (GGDEF domain) with PAS/PAC sensor n=1 Tax=hydrothermal vent metagenome TaxID=652676 RepID=A0A3B0X124_9ZZZZ
MDIKDSIADMHWLMDMLQNIDIGLVVIDHQYNIHVWNSFMENHSGESPTGVIGKNLFKKFSAIPEDWFKRKAESVFLLGNRSFTTWEQRDYLFQFKNYRPITGTADYMYQNITLIPLLSADSTVQHVGVIIYDVTDIAVSKLQLEKSNLQLQALSRTDALTQLNNRGYWETCLVAEYNRSKRTHQSCTLLIFDIDHFKKVNDTYGHQAGDEVIRNVSDILRNSIRVSDIAGRYGGEEFVVLLIDTQASNALIFAERLRKKIEAVTVTHEKVDIKYTISLGLAEMIGSTKDYKHWLECADNALYQAKDSGRNKSIIYAEKIENHDNKK